MKKALLLLLVALPLAAQSDTIPCGPELSGGAALTPVPEISSADTGVLSGTLYTVSEQARMPAGAEGSTPVCHSQWVRAYRKDPPANWNPPSSQITTPFPGPTLRAKVGDVVNLTFLNSIDANKFLNSDAGCDETTAYPGTTGDKYPHCFADSVFTNVHYHGTHTSPNTTADNVFINVRPSPRDPAKNNAPLITAADVQKTFGDFFAQCRKEFANATGPKMWPRKWKDIPPDLQTQLTKYVTDYGLAGWSAGNQKLIDDGFWPQYFVGAYPYCFKLPKWTDPATTPEAPSTAITSPHTHGAGSSEVDEAAEPTRPLVMGQSPGTHWYHAHKHGSTTINVMNGMTGVFVIEGDSYDKVIRDYYGLNFTEQVLVVQGLGVAPNLLFPGQFGDVNFFVNGKFKPVLQMAGNSVQMWRIANTAGRAGAYFPAPKGLQWKQLAVDGVQLTPDNYWNRPNQFLLMSGNRIDLLVKAPPFNATDSTKNRYDVIVYNTVDPSDRPPIKPTAPALTLFTVEVTANGPDMQFIPKAGAPKQPAFLKDIDDEKITGTKILKFGTKKTPPNTAPAHTIDGNLFNGELGAVVELNRNEEWKVVNETYGPLISHPFHIHINPFQLDEIFEPGSYIPVSGAGKGTVAVTVNLPTVTGTGTSFRTDFQAGDVININNGQGGTIKSIEDATHLTLTGNATATVTGAGYSMLIPQYTIDKATMRAGQCYLDPNVKKTWVPCGPPEPSLQRVWWDVFPIPSGKTFTSGATTANIPGYFKMRSRFVDYPGYFVLHCHILAHEDRGMMTVVGVAPIQTPYSHH
ncbi:MAG TPA: multicopper oxidase domain-containing protein [Thermoanaerobaculia bacterium]|nr:multicopper oxidase domain-containing protein [Thermoanaerobaculia bacterium]